MSSVVISGNTSGTITLDAPAVAGTTTLTLPATSGTVFVGGQALSATTGSFSGNVTLGSAVLETPTGTAPIYAARAWVLINGSNGATLASGNVSSTSRLGTGNYEINFATAMPDTNYAVVSDSGWTGPVNGSMNTWSNQTTTQTRVWARNQFSNVAHDSVTVSVQIFR